MCAWTLKTELDLLDLSDAIDLSLRDPVRPVRELDSLELSGFDPFPNRRVGHVENPGHLIGPV